MFGVFQGNIAPGQNNEVNIIELQAFNGEMTRNEPMNGRTGVRNNAFVREYDRR